MLNFFKKLFQMIFGGAEESPKETPTPQTPTTTEAKKEEKVEEPSSDEGLQVSLKRESYGMQDTVGKMYINGKFAAFTLESPKSSCIPEGSYPLTLRKTGGKHSSYWFRFKHMHKGMIFIDSKKEDLFPYLSIGNIGKEAKGSILLGTELKNEDSTDAAREVWYSTQAYKTLYPTIADALESGQELMLEISS